MAVMICLRDSERTLQEQNTFSELLYRKNGCKQVLNTFFKMLKDVGMALPKTTATRCRVGSVQARHVIQRLHK